MRKIKNMKKIGLGTVEVTYTTPKGTYKTHRNLRYSRPPKNSSRSKYAADEYIIFDGKKRIIRKVA